ncbi:MAG: RNA polymerase factor sigma-54 [Paludibacteraceae bacterium]|nr:RNA polymerase factor sigma-54 [Paludibacteraceae bacterium]
MSLKEQTTLKQQQKLSPSQILVANLLESPLLELEDKIKTEVEDNPALEEILPQKNALNETTGNERTEDFYMDGGDSGDEDSDANVNVNDYETYDEMEDFDTPYVYGGNYDVPVDYNPAYADDQSFAEYLSSQFAPMAENPLQRQLGEFIIGSLDDDGYLKADIAKLTDAINIHYSLGVTEADLYEALLLVQKLEPAGVGARTLRECLRLQAERCVDDDVENSKVAQTAVDVLDGFFDYFTAKRYSFIQNKLHIDNNLLNKVVEFIKKLNPHPCNAFTEAKYMKAHDAVTPDFYYDGESDILTLNNGNIPKLSVSREYEDMLKKHSDKETSAFVKQKIESANQLIEAIEQRGEILVRVMTAIIKAQKEFFMHGDDSYLKPLTMQNIADIAGCDVSTVSRAANKKYIETDFGLFSLRHFFSEGIATDTGEEISSREIKSIIRSLIDSEDKENPLTDDALCDKLNERGFRIARRTVAKYRETLKFPTARLRRV